MVGHEKGPSVRRIESYDIKFLQRALTAECERNCTQAPGTYNKRRRHVCSCLATLAAIRNVAFTGLLISLQPFMSTGHPDTPCD